MSYFFCFESIFENYVNKKYFIFIDYVNFRVNGFGFCNIEEKF